MPFCTAAFKRSLAVRLPDNENAATVEVVERAPPTSSGDLNESGAALTNIHFSWFERWLYLP
jgi:hypothetical protein